MNDQMNFFDRALCYLVKRRGLQDQLKPKGRFYVEHYRNGELLDSYDITNGITNVGKNALLDIMFDGGTQITTWYTGLINASGYTAVAALDTMGSHTGWTEFTSYSQANRVQWNPDAANAQSITNSTLVTFDITSSGTLKGIFITSDNTKSGTTGTLWSTALFSSDVTVANTDQFKIVYSLSC